VLADGSYFVASPSTIDGKAYEWVDPSQAAPFPEWFLSLEKPSKEEKLLTNTRSMLVRNLLPNGREINGQWETRCPFHDDDHPSFYVKLKDGVFFCHACEEKGSFETLYAKVKNISVDEARRILRPLPPFIEKLNKEHAIVKVGGKCVILNEEPHATENWKTTSFSSRADFLLQYQNRRERIKGKWVPIAKEWLGHPQRRQYRGIDFAPPPKVLRNDYYNLWQGFAVKPKPGDCSLFLQLVLEVAAQNDPGLNRYILGQMAQAVQQPANRNGISLVFTGKQGTGKSVLLTLYGSLWGVHFFHARDWRQLTGNFNAHLKNISLLFADEVAAESRGSRGSRESSVAEGVLKALITEEWIPIEFKGKDVIQVKNFIRVMMATNKTWAVPAGLEERRFSVIKMGEAHIQDRSYFRAIHEQMNKGGREALLHYLLNYDISDIDLDKPYETAAHIQNKLLSMSKQERFWLEILERGTVLDPIWNPIINKEKLYQTYSYWANEEMGKGNQTAFWIALGNLCPHKKDVRLRGTRCVDVGSLQKCQDAFDQAINWSNHSWDAPEVETDVPRLPLPPSKPMELEEYNNFDQFRSEG
jgi:hypothetical protein